MDVVKRIINLPFPPSYKLFILYLYLFKQNELWGHQQIGSEVFSGSECLSKKTTKALYVLGYIDKKRTGKQIPNNYFFTQKGLELLEDTNAKV